MQYLPLFLQLLAALIAGYFYLQRAKARPTNRVEGPTTDTAAPPPDERGPESDRDA